MSNPFNQLAPNLQTKNRVIDCVLTLMENDDYMQHHVFKHPEIEGACVADINAGLGEAMASLSHAYHWPTTITHEGNHLRLRANQGIEYRGEECPLLWRRYVTDGYDKRGVHRVSVDLFSNGTIRVVMR